MNKDELKLIIERIENLEEEKANLTNDIKDVYLEAKAKGFDVKTLKQVISFRKQDKNEREEKQALLDLYLATLGNI